LPNPRGRVTQVNRATEQARWLVENEQAIDQYNAFVERYGVFSDDFRQF
jgi:post-segregation antitoxin (ccd killing protein)